MNEDELCEELHPLAGVRCIKKSGHAKQHYFVAGWESWDAAVEDFRNHRAVLVGGRSNRELVEACMEAQRLFWRGALADHEAK